MKQTITVGAAFFLYVLVYANAAAEFESVSGADLKKICATYTDAPSNTSEGMCIGYVVGVMSILHSLDVLCFPDKATHAQATLVVQKHLSDHPEMLHLNSEELVIDALLEAFPCTSTQTD